MKRILITAVALVALLALAGNALAAKSSEDRLKDLEQNKHQNKPLEGKLYTEPLSFAKDEEHERKMERGSTMLRNAVLSLILTRDSHAAS